MAGTALSQDHVKQMWELGVEPHVWNGEAPLEGSMRIMRGVTHILHANRPTKKGDMVLKHHADLLTQIAPNLKWYGYLSSVAVYGDTKNEIATESFEPNPISAMGQLYLRCEKRHRKLHKKDGLPLHVFRCGSIYGPRQNAFRRASSGAPSIVHKSGHVTPFIHVRDLNQIISASIIHPDPGAIYNCVDDLAVGPEKPIEIAYELLGKTKPPVVEFGGEDVQVPKGLLPQYLESQQVSNERVKSELDVALQFPTYRDGYKALSESRRKAMEAQAE